MKHIVSRTLAQFAALLFSLLSAPSAAQPLRHPVTGRLIAPVMGAAGVHWLERAGREPEQRPSLAVQWLRIQPGMIRLLEDRIRRRRLSNVHVVLCTESDPRLPPESLDLALLVDVYHEFARPREMLRGIRRALKPGARLVLIEFRKEDPAVPIREEHKMSVAEARAEVEPEGFVFDRVLYGLPWQHMLIFRK